MSSSRARKRTREVGEIDTVRGHRGDPQDDRHRKSASVFVATMLGALTISRIVADPKVSNEILAAARAKLSSWE